MNYYYLIAQLPALDGVTDAMALPITEERLDALCRQFLGKRAYARLIALTLTPPREAEKTGSSLIDAWNAHERVLRLALAARRAERMGKDLDTAVPTPDPALVAVLDAALTCEQPLEAEQVLLAYRLATLERLRPADAFSEETLYYYAIKLKLLSRMRAFDTARGEANYRTIYDSIIRGEKQEVIQ